MQRLLGSEIIHGWYLTGFQAENFGLSVYLNKSKKIIVMISFPNVKCTNLYLLIKSVLSCCLVTVNELSTWPEAIRVPSGFEFMI